MDWMAFEKQWRRRDEILLAVAQDRVNDKETGVAAFFILMILGIGSQYCRQQNPSGLLGAYDYYCLAQPYLNHIVQLHNLANIQGETIPGITLKPPRSASASYLLATRYTRAVRMVHLRCDHATVS